MSGYCNPSHQTRMALRSPSSHRTSESCRHKNVFLHQPSSVRLRPVIRPLWPETKTQKAGLAVRSLPLRARSHAAEPPPHLRVAWHLGHPSSSSSIAWSIASSSRHVLIGSDLRLLFLPSEEEAQARKRKERSLRASLL